MIKQITPEQLPVDVLKAYEGWQDNFKKSIDSDEFIPYTQYEGEDKNLLALRSKEEFMSWYGQSPGKIGEPYRDNGFYVRELTWLSMWANPRTVVEFGTDKGIGTFILKRLNPQSTLYTVDISLKVQMPPNDQRVDAGFFALLNKLNAVFVHANSKNFECIDPVDFCFIDGDHSKDKVWQDSLRAWANRSKNGRWVIVWHDFRDEEAFAGLKISVHRFSDLVRKKVYKFEDSATAWMYGDPSEA